MGHPEEPGKSWPRRFPRRVELDGAKLAVLGPGVFHDMEIDGTKWTNLGPGGFHVVWNLIGPSWQILGLVFSMSSAGISIRVSPDSNPSGET